MDSSMRSDPSGSKCMLTLYHVDSRISDTESCGTIEVSFSKQTAYKADSIVAFYFDVEQEWDKKLLKCIFLNDINFNWFEFQRADTPEITLGVQIKGNRSIVFNASPEKSYVPIKKTGKIAVRFRGHTFGNKEYELDYEQIKNETNINYSIVALFNSNSFKGVKEYSTNLGYTRTLEKVDGFGKARL